MDHILLQVLVPIATAAISYFAAINKSKKELDIVKEQCSNEINKIKIQSEHELNKLELEIDKQASLYEKNTQVDLTKEILSGVFSSSNLNELVSNTMSREFQKKFKN
ncbi:hypothetical protein [Alkalihalophilus marmarensis]|uniref:Uncharacterized protein n=1 Tax=Alkalihalophilus marmarensis DSM 21297 TaxID=1188261 RepID=U6SSL9_9BACI|nr:hypothetical protein [Alkalihalophilus marmarensis]ERN54332.1 hypothetical protein A33I_07900 [Alkalihalophilus marmarensis DSM 21297]